MQEDIKLVIPDEIKTKYNNALTRLANGENTLIGYKPQLEMLDNAMYNPETPNAMVLGEQGIGKTALVEQWAYNRSLTETPVIIVALGIETLGALNENVMVSRMRTLLDDVNKIEDATKVANNGRNFELVLFIDEVHKLNNYGKATSGSQGSSGAMNALKEGLARGKCKIVTATTDYEYRGNIIKDPAFDRRFGKVIMEQPNADTVIQILKRRLEKWNEKFNFKPKVDDKIYKEIVSLTDAFVRDQVNPAKTLKIFSLCYGICRRLHSQQGKGEVMTHKVVAVAFASEGYNVDSLTTAEHVNKVVHRRVKGQPLALKFLTDTINTTFYSKRNFKRPLMTAFEVGTTGTGKSETAKAMAEAFYGREDALLNLNGGDYPTKEDAIRAQHFIGDHVQVNKQQVILLDEIEKSHPNVLYAYMRMIDEGIVRDSLNIERSINNTIVIATSNLGAKIFGDLASSMRLDEIRYPDRLTEDIVDKWYRQEASVREALQNGDANLHNGIKPEFLERFQLFIPFLPLPRKIMAQIARNKLLKYQQEQKELGYNIQLPSPKSYQEWQKLMPHSVYEDIDTVSVMIAEDIINSNASTAGARSINRFIETSVKPKVANTIYLRDRKHLSLDGALRITTNGHAIFEDTNRIRPDVSVKFVARGDTSYYE